MKKKTFTAVVDRIEDDAAVMEADGGEFEIAFPLQLLPPRIREGDFIKITVAFDDEAKKRQILEIEELRKQI